MIKTQRVWVPVLVQTDTDSEGTQRHKTACFGKLIDIGTASAKAQPVMT